MSLKLKVSVCSSIVRGKKLILIRNFMKRDVFVCFRSLELNNVRLFIFNSC